MEVSPANANTVNANKRLVFADCIRRWRFLKTECSGALQYDCFHELFLPATRAIRTEPEAG
jgi:hypothetical protein